MIFHLVVNTVGLALQPPCHFLELFQLGLYNFGFRLDLLEDLAGLFKAVGGVPYSGP